MWHDHSHTLLLGIGTHALRMSLINVYIYNKHINKYILKNSSFFCKQKKKFLNVKSYQHKIFNIFHSMHNVSKIFINFVGTVNNIQQYKYLDNNQHV